MQKRAQQTRQQMAEKEQELGLMNQEIMKLCEEVQLRVQQVKQYKKQADKYMEEAVMQKELVSTASVTFYRLLIALVSPSGLNYSIEMRGGVL